jgi:hypothetical protein
MQAVGKDFMVVPLASGIHVSLAGATGVTFVVYENGGATAIGLKESIAGASEQNLAVINDYLAGDGIGGVLTHETADANAELDDDYAMVKKDTTPFDMAILYVGASQLSDGFDSVECTVDGGTCVAILHGLSVQRNPVNLAAIGV